LSNAAARRMRPLSIEDFTDRADTPLHRDGRETRRETRAPA
jgi:hypothetical protein